VKTLRYTSKLCQATSSSNCVEGLPRCVPQSRRLIHDSYSVVSALSEIGDSFGLDEPCRTQIARFQGCGEISTYVCKDDLSSVSACLLFSL
jgi:hypothetical protein